MSFEYLHFIFLYFVSAKLKLNYNSIIGRVIKVDDNRTRMKISLFIFCCLTGLKDPPADVLVVGSVGGGGSLVELY